MKKTKWYCLNIPFMIGAANNDIRVIELEEVLCLQFEEKFKHLIVAKGETFDEVIETVKVKLRK